MKIRITSVKRYELSVTCSLLLIIKVYNSPVNLMLCFVLISGERCEMSTYFFPRKSHAKFYTDIYTTWYGYPSHQEWYCWSVIWLVCQVWVWTIYVWCDSTYWSIGMTKSRHRLFKQNTESPGFCWRITGNQPTIIRSKSLRSGHFIPYEHWGAGGWRGVGRREGKLSVSFYSSVILFPTRSSQS